jgi:hypothetical protein
VRYLLALLLCAGCRCVVVATGDARVEVVISEPNKTISPPVHVEVPLK